jgi:hypothetical protein
MRLFKRSTSLSFSTWIRAYGIFLVANYVDSIANKFYNSVSFISNERKKTNKKIIL